MREQLSAHVHAAHRVVNSFHVGVRQIERGQPGGADLSLSAGRAWDGWVLTGRDDPCVCLCCGVASEGQRGQGVHGKRGQETDRYGSTYQVSPISICFSLRDYKSIQVNNLGKRCDLGFLLRIHGRDPFGSFRG